MKQIAAKQKDIAKDIAAFDKAELDALKKTQAKLNQDLAQLKATVRAAKAKVPAT
jgi:septal ring factor EnvC (AmiA/AmiB activator)